jgi:hypothetical protein
MVPELFIYFEVEVLARKWKFVMTFALNNL